MHWGINLPVVNKIHWGINLPVSHKMHWGINLPVFNKRHWGINLPVSHKMHKKGSAVSLVLKVRVFCNSEMAYSPLVPLP